MANNNIITILNRIILISDPGIDGPYGTKTTLDDEGYDMLLEEFKKFYDNNNRHNYHEITKFLITKYNESEQSQEDCVTVAMTIKNLVEIADSKCLNDCAKLKCDKLDPPKFRCDNHIYSECHAYKIVARALNKLYDHMQLEITRLNAIQADNKKVMLKWKKLEISIKKTTAQQKDATDEFTQGKTEIDEAINTFKKTKKELTDKVEDISKKYTDINDTYKKLLEKENDMQTKADRIMNQAEDIQDQTKQIYIQVVTILGIFTSVVFALFGGINGISIIANAFVSENIEIYKLMLLTSIIGIFIFDLVFVLLGMVFRLIKVDSKLSVFAVCIVVIVNIFCMCCGIYSGYNLINNNNKKVENNRTDMRVDYTVGVNTTKGNITK